MRVTYIRWSRFCTVHFCLKNKIILGISLIFISSATTCLPTGCTLQSHQCSGCFHHETWLTQIILTDHHPSVTSKSQSGETWAREQDAFALVFSTLPRPHVSPRLCAHTHPMVTITCRHTLPSCFFIYFSGGFPLERAGGGAFDWNSLLEAEAPLLIVPAWEKLSSVASSPCLHFLVCKMAQYRHIFVKEVWWLCWAAHRPWLNSPLCKKDSALYYQPCYHLKDRPKP